MLNRRKFIKNNGLATCIFISPGIIDLVKLTDQGSIVNQFLSSNFFPYGVASGDPTSFGVIIWTRVKPITNKRVTVKWILAEDEKFTNITQSGDVIISNDNDYTVKVDVQGLSPSMIYYYQFISDQIKSPIGRTKTTSYSGFQDLQFAVVSCSDYSAGFYNALANIAARKELDAVIYLGDYIYEGTIRSFDTDNIIEDDEYEATHFNRTRDWWLHYYRRRYALNRLDPDLQAAHLAHPFISIWDDHEIANNAWKGGAQGHNEEKDGEWDIRKSAAKQVYTEWMPIRGNGEKIYRSIRFGNLAELILLDTRIEGRDEQIYSPSNPRLFATNRTILGKEQKDWLFNQLKNSASQWKIIGNQVIFSEINIKWASHFTDKVTILENTVLDYWEGYPVERDEVLEQISQNKINDVVILSASMHCAIAFDVTKRATPYSRRGENTTYNSLTGKGSIAVEFACPSITSANFDEKMGKFNANTFQLLLNKKLPSPLNYNPNPHMKFVDLQRHGYLILHITKEKAEASFYFVDHLQKRINNEKRSEVWHTKTGKNKLERTK